MKSLALIFVSSFLLSACCKKEPYPVAGITLIYPNLSSSGTLKAARTEKNNLSVIIDTINIAELSASNNYSAIIEFDENAPNYILFIEESSYNDTISEINFERNGCKEKIKNVEYRFNGELKTDNELIIN